LSTFRAYSRNPWVLRQFSRSVFGQQCIIIVYTNVCRRMYSLSPLECVSTLPEKLSDTSSMRMACRRCPGALMAIRGWQTPLHCVGSSLAAFCLLWFVSQKHGVLLPPFLLLIAHEDLHHILYRGSTMVVGCCVTQSLCRTWGSQCRLLDFWIG